MAGVVPYDSLKTLQPLYEFLRDHYLNWTEIYNMDHDIWVDLELDRRLMNDVYFVMTFVKQKMEEIELLQRLEFLSHQPGTLMNGTNTEDMRTLIWQQGHMSLSDWQRKLQEKFPTTGKTFMGTLYSWPNGGPLAHTAIDLYIKIFNGDVDLPVPFEEFLYYTVEGRKGLRDRPGVLPLYEYMLTDKRTKDPSFVLRLRQSSTLGAFLPTNPTLSNSFLTRGSPSFSNSFLTRGSPSFSNSFLI